MANAVRLEGVQLKPAQRRALDALASGRTGELSRARYQEIAGVSRSQAAYDLADLVEAGVLVRVGAGRSTRYRLPASSPQAGRRRWTSDRIRAELQAFCAGRTSWPSAAEFKRAGRSDLYVAASRYGGIGFWAAEVGLGPASRPAVDEPRARRPLWGRRTVLALAGLLLLLALGATAAGLALWPRDSKAGAASAAVRRPEPLAADLRSLRLAVAAGRAEQAASSREAPASRATLSLRARRGSSWVSVRSAAGRLLYAGTLAFGRRLRLRGSALWVRLGTAANLDVSANGGREARLPGRAALVVVTRRGIRVVEWAPEPSPPQLVTSQVPRSVVTPTTQPAAAEPPATAASRPAAPAPRPAAPAPSKHATSSSWPTPLPAP